jgi:hypothetical protein
MPRPSRLVLQLLPLIALLCAPPFAPEARAFCGFFVGKADSKLFNQASQVGLVRDGEKTVLTMANDFQGEPREFALVIPVPNFIEREQIAVVDKGLLDHLDAYSAPRLVEYFDEDPCRPRAEMMMRAAGAPQAVPAPAGQKHGVTVEATYTVGEYDILILSAKESTGLELWLKENGYRIPAGASAVLGSYLKQQMRFFVAKVNIKEQAKLGFTYLRPLQVSYASPKFMLPIRLGTVNAHGPQELFVFALTRKGRVETTNYRTVKLPTGMDLPAYVKEDFAPFYKAMFGEQVRREDMRAVFMEYAWDTGWCDPCAADPLSNDELKKLGVSWLDAAEPNRPPGFVRQGSPVFVTRLHVRYDRDHFPEDLAFQETADRTNFQGRYVLRHAWKGEAACDAARSYREGLPRRYEQEAQNLATLTGWDVNDIRRKMGSGPKISDVGRPGFWARLFGR